MKYLFSLLFLLSLPISAFNVIYTSEYIDVLNEKVILDSSITIDKGLIVSIDSGYIEVDKTNSLIDLRGYTLMPGLMDMHVHFGQEYLSKSERPGKVERETAAIMATQHAYKTLKAGFTTVRQVGDSGMVAISLRDAINAGHVLSLIHI